MLGRISEMQSEKLKTINAETPVYHGIPSKEKWELGLTGQVHRHSEEKARKYQEDGVFGYNSCNVDDVWDFSDIAVTHRVENDQTETNTKRVASLKKAVQKLKDRVMLGDSETAVTLLEDFSGQDF